MNFLRRRRPEEQTVEGLPLEEVARQITALRVGLGWAPADVYRAMQHMGMKRSNVYTAEKRPEQVPNAARAILAFLRDPFPVVPEPEPTPVPQDM